jgi:hypothetical protein
MSDEIKRMGDEVLADHAKEVAADISFTSLSLNAQAVAATLPREPDKITVKNSNTRTVEWENQNAYWQHNRR